MKKFAFWLLPISWMGVLFFSSSQEYEKQDIKPLLSELIDLSFLTPYLDWVSLTYHYSEVSIAALGINGFIEFFIRKGAHFSVYFILLLFFYFAFRKTVSWNFQKVLVVSFSLTAAYAIVDEIHQGFTPNRTPYFGDVMIDCTGAIIACCIIFWRHHWREIKR